MRLLPPLISKKTPLTPGSSSLSLTSISYASVLAAGRRRALGQPVQSQGTFVPCPLLPCVCVCVCVGGQCLVSVGGDGNSPPSRAFPAQGSSLSGTKA